ncbi:MAG: ATP-dependent DNA helicase [Desulfobacterales bacterium]|nr:ATP-dependent DNA helicase [Desulfobacterales bacterium]
MSVTHKVAVKAMVARVLRSGDLRIEFSDASRSRDGIRIHRRIQKSRPSHYEAEVPVNIVVETAKIDLAVSGRIDGIYLDTGSCTVEEIKTTARDLDQISQDPDPVHLGQARCYAYMYAVEKKLTGVKIHLTYCQIKSAKTATWEQTYPLAELEHWFDTIVTRYLKQIELYLDWQTCRDVSIAALDFPFDDYRTGQRAMAVDVYRAIRDRKQLLVQAATGIGKTMAALFPAIKAMAGIENPVILYLTARTTGRLAADKAMGVMRTKGLRLKTLTITAKDKICFLAERSCNPEDCEFAQGYFDRVDAAIRSVFASDDFSRSRIEATAREFGICPFEFSLELVFYSDCLICDYNYAFDPRVSLKRLIGESDRNCVYLVDEAHNLVDRSREMFSAQIEKQAVLDVRRKIGKQLRPVFKSLGKINSWMVTARKQCQQLPGGAFSQEQAPLELLTRLTVFVRSAEKWLVKNLKTPFREDLLAVYFHGVNFLKTADQYGDEYITFMEQSGKNLRIKLFCLDPADQLKAAMDNSIAVIFFSGTMTPAAYFRRLFGCPADTTALQIGSPFPDANLGLFVADRISTLYRQRGETLTQLGEILLAMVTKKSGNYLFFFPSYRYLTMVHATIVQTQPAFSIIVQTPEMHHTEKTEFLRHFQEKRDDTLVGFAVLGGIFGEGIDLDGDKLSGAAVVGVGLPGISYENELIKAYFNTAEGAGFQYAYQYPGINRVLQGAGRVIRTDQDRGIVLLVDQRYGRHSYRSMLPEHWQPVRIGNSEDLEVALGYFWRNGGDTN